MGAMLEQSWPAGQQRTVVLAASGMQALPVAQQKSLGRPEPHWVKFAAHVDCLSSSRPGGRSEAAQLAETAASVTARRNI